MRSCGKATIDGPNFRRVWPAAQDLARGPSLMLFALVCVAMLLLVLGAVGLPLLSGTKTSPDRAQYDRAVYRDQLLEVERDVARGVLSASEADAARLEIHRRLLAVNGSIEPAATVARSSPLMAAVTGLAVIVGAGGLYWRLGQPNLSDAPF